MLSLSALILAAALSANPTSTVNPVCPHADLAGTYRFTAANTYQGTQDHFTLTLTRTTGCALRIDIATSGSKTKPRLHGTASVGPPHHTKAHTTLEVRMTLHPTAKRTSAAPRHALFRLFITPKGHLTGLWANDGKTFEKEPASGPLAGLKGAGKPLPMAKLPTPACTLVCEANHGWALDDTGKVANNTPGNAHNLCMDRCSGQANSP